ncbi:MAG: FadR family transcriptional regulator [Deltaproteobacteria bacterium]|nr:FadR family transcriptional regulator [Deltaproteobacteria bacterium]
MNRKQDIFSHVSSPRISELIEKQIKEAIYSGYYAIGDKLPPERELAGLFGASRSIVREALRSLEKSGLLNIKTGVQGGAFVTEVNTRPIMASLEDMMQARQISHEEILQVRLFLEPRGF